MPSNDPGLVTRASVQGWFRFDVPRRAGEHASGHDIVHSTGVGGGVDSGHDGDVTDAASGQAPNTDTPTSSDRRSRPPTEPRWPLVLAVLASIAMQFALPDRHVLSPTFLFPTVEALLLIALLIADPSHLHRRSVVLRRVLLALVIIMTVDNLAAVVEMVRGILDGSKGDTGTVLLATGGAIWLTNVIAFSLWYWLLDRGGPAARASGEPSPPAFAFAEMQLTELASADWSPQFADYFYLAFTNATAFSPTDTLPITRWAKMMMLVQSAISLVVAVMIISRAVNILN